MINKLCDKDIINTPSFDLYSQRTRDLEASYALLESSFFDLKEKLEASHHTLCEIVTHLSEGLLFISQEGRISLFNAAAEELLGFSSKKALNTLFWDTFSDHFFGFSMRLALSELPTTAHKRVIIALANERELDVSTSAIQEKGLLLLLSNRKERETLEKSLHQTERLQELGEMAATLAHEIRNPLGGIEGFAQLLKRDLEIPTHQRMIQAILQGTRTLNHLVTQVLEYAKPFQPSLVETNFPLLVQEVIELSILSFPNLEIVFSSPTEMSAMLLDRELIKLVLFNLIRNASEAKASYITLELTQEKVFTIKDNGTGIAAKLLQKIFTPFFTTKTQGTGLGLAQSAAIIKAHGAQLEVSSIEGEGTQFIVRFQG